MVSPSDPLPRPPFVLGGRVLALEGSAEGPRIAIVADAFDERPVSGILGEVTVGDLVEIDVRALGHDGRLVAEGLRIVGRDRREPKAIRERGRLALRRRGHNLRLRAELLDAIRAFFAARRYLEVETPALVPSPGMDVHLDAFEVRDEGPRATPRFLATSPEYQMKRLLAGGMPRIFQLGRCYRRGEVGARHNPEFTMLEWYRAFASMSEMIEETEALIVDVAIAARGKPELVAPDEARGRSATRVVSLSPPFERLPIARAFARHTKLSEEQALGLALSGSAEDEERFFRLLVDEVEPALAEGPPVVLLDYPVTQASLARRKADDPRLAERFEIFVAGIELCNGFGELVDPVEQRRRFEEDQRLRAAAGKAVLPIDERFLEALDEGMPPSAGNALGVDRLVALAAGAGEIGDVQSFPEGWL